MSIQIIEGVTPQIAIPPQFLKCSFFNDAAVFDGDAEFLRTFSQRAVRILEKSFIDFLLTRLFRLRFVGEFIDNGLCGGQCAEADIAR